MAIANPAEPGAAGR
ncbi:arginine and alanine rich protein, partial [Mycobacterium tuberculosis Kc 32216]